VLPFDTLRAYRVVPLEWNQEGRLIVACETLPDAATVERLEHEAGCRIEFCLATASDVSYGLHLLAMVESHQAQWDVPDGAPLGVRVRNPGRLTEPQLREALRRQREQYKPFGAYAVEQGYLDQKQLDESVPAAAQAKVPLGAYLVKNGYLSEGACAQIIAAMGRNRQLLGEILVETNILLKDQQEEGMSCGMEM
jgi:hypothetical protein